MFEGFLVLLWISTSNMENSVNDCVYVCLYERLVISWVVLFLDDKNRFLVKILRDIFDIQISSKFVACVWMQFQQHNSSRETEFAGCIITYIFWFARNYVVSWAELIKLNLVNSYVKTDSIFTYECISHVSIR